MDTCSKQFPYVRIVMFASAVSALMHDDATFPGIVQGSLSFLMLYLGMVSSETVVQFFEKPVILAWSASSLSHVFYCFRSRLLISIWTVIEPLPSGAQILVPTLMWTSTLGLLSSSGRESQQIAVCWPWILHALPNSWLRMQSDYLALLSFQASAQHLKDVPLVSVLLLADPDVEDGLVSTRGSDPQSVRPVSILSSI